MSEHRVEGANQMVNLGLFLLLFALLFESQTSHCPAALLILLSLVWTQMGSLASSSWDWSCLLGEKNGNKSRFNLLFTLVYHIHWRYREHFPLGAVFATRKIFTVPLPWELLKPPCPKEVERMGGYGYMDVSFGNRVKYQTFYRPEWFL